MALYHSTFRRFDAPSCKVTPVVQLTTVSTILITACRTVFCRCSASRHTMKSCRLRSCGRITRYNFDVGYYALYTTETAMFYDRML